MSNSNNISPILFTFLLSVILCLNEAHSRQSTEESPGEFYHVVETRSLFPEQSCKPSAPTGEKHGATLEVVHRHGPCSKLNSGKANNMPSFTEILERDQARVNSIRSRVSLNSGRSQAVEKAATLPALDGSTIGSANYIVTIGLGTPKKDLSLIFDTGSDMTWTQCKPCAGSCYKQHDHIFDPTKSSTYANISCNSALCSSVASATSAKPGCSHSTCVYAIQYGDNSFSIGFFAKETLTLSSKDVFKNFMFGCGENNQGLFEGTAGLIGLGRDRLSGASQIGTKYGKYFSYCLPTTSSTGYLTFGKGDKIPKATSYTPLLTGSQSPTLYFVTLLAIRVGHTKLSISPTVFSTVGTIIDSGTVLTYLPPHAYSALKSAFRKKMSKYPLTSPTSLLDTCYDFSKHSSLAVPKISLYFSGRAKMELDTIGILAGQNMSQVCLAFAANSNASDVGILGNVLQQTFNVIYDIGGGKLGFAPGGCS
ncbi:hypothetical protein Ancab_023146 [Ancistrocladus abbreviatus]